MAHPRLLSIILAGGKGERLFPLTAMRSKPAVPFGGRYRIVDFVLSNMVNSSIFSNYLLVQYKSQSLIEHIRKNWVLSPIMRNQFVAVVPPQMRKGKEWFQGTADAVYQNANLIIDQDPELVIIFGADHIYRMDVRQMVDFHLENVADVTVAARPVPVEDASAFGVIGVDSENRITAFKEKPKKPPHIPGDPSRSLVSMGNYIFSKDVLLESLAKAESRKQDDFGKHILPDLVSSGKLFAYDFETNKVPGLKPGEERGYWRDVGTIQAFFDAHMDLLGPEPAFDLNNLEWPMLTGTLAGLSSARIYKGSIQNSLVSEGAQIMGGKIKGSVIRPGVRVESGAVIENCIIMDNVVIKKGANLRNVIVDKNNIIEEGSEIGFDQKKDRFLSHIDPSGIAVLPRGGKTRAHNRKKKS
jgi:glucose-1-phosphate adenylyltransferase